MACMMAMGFPLLAQEQQRALGQRDITVLIALAAADVQEHALRIDVADLQAQPFAQAQTAGINGAEADPMIQGGDAGQNAAHLGGREHDGEFELGVGQAGPAPTALRAKRLGSRRSLVDGADGLGAGLACDLLVGLEMNAILAELLGGDQLGDLA